MNYFVTGATGFIGRFLLTELLARPEAEVYVLVRPSSRARFEAKAQRFGAAASRLHVVEGDLTADRLVTDPDPAALPGHVHHVFHLAAVYDMAMTEDAAAEVNLRGTTRVVDFVNRLPRPVCLHHVSSVAVAGPFVEGVFREDDFDVGQPLEHPYYRSKFDAERVVRERCEGSYRIYRPGIVVGHSQTGEIEKVDGPYYFFGLVRAIAPRLPRWLPLFIVEGGRMPIVPVDYVARAMDAIAHSPEGDGLTFALIAPSPPSVGQLVAGLFEVAGGPKVRRIRVPPLAWLANRIARAVGMLVPARLAAWVTTITGVPTSVYGQLFTQTTYDDTNARRLLANTHVRCPPFDALAQPMWSGWERFREVPTTALLTPGA